MADPNRRDKFQLPNGVIYLDGNSLGPLPIGVTEFVGDTMTQAWGKRLIKAWNADDWITLSQRVGGKIARLIGAHPGTVRACDSTSVNLYKVLSAALAMKGNCGAILSDTGNFPTDLYVAQGLASRLPDVTLRMVAPHDVYDAINGDVAVVMLTQVDYRTGRKHDMHEITTLAHDVGALVIWDLAHSAGAFDVRLEAAQADFAVGCGYKYLNGGPGAPAFLYVAERHLSALPNMVGWFGHAAPFAFETEFEPSQSIDRFTVGTPPVLSMVALEAALALWDDVDLRAVQERSTLLTDTFINSVSEFADAYELHLATPRDPAMRGSHVSWHHPHAYPVMQALIDRGVIGDMRAPDFLRFGFAPLFNTVDEVREAAAVLHDILKTRYWDQPQFHARKAVT